VCQCTQQAETFCCGGIDISDHATHFWGPVPVCPRPAPAIDANKEKTWHWGRPPNNGSLQQDFVSITFHKHEFSTRIGRGKLDATFHQTVTALQQNYSIVGTTVINNRGKK